MKKELCEKMARVLYCKLPQYYLRAATDQTLLSLVAMLQHESNMSSKHDIPRSKALEPLSGAWRGLGVAKVKTMIGFFIADYSGNGFKFGSQNAQQPHLRVLG